MNAEKPVLVGYDGSAASEVALRWALAEARVRDLPVRLLHSAMPDAMMAGLSMGYYAPDEETLVTGGSAVLAEASSRAHQWAPDVKVTTELSLKTPATSLLEAMHGASLVVVGSRGLTAFHELLAGSTSIQVATHATVPVIVIRAGDVGEPGPEQGRVVVGVDGSPSSFDALGFAFDEASVRGTGITVVRAWYSSYFDSPGAKGGTIPAHVEAELFVPNETAALRDEMAPWLDKYPEVDVRQVVVHANAAQALVGISRGAELLVVGSRGRGGFVSLLLGSVGHAVLHHAFCPVSVVPSARDHA